MRVFFSVLALGVLAATTAPAAIIYGLESQDLSSGMVSQAPTALFRFDTNNPAATFSRLAVTRLVGSTTTQLNVDGLAVSGAGTLYGFELHTGGSTLVTIDPATGRVTTVSLLAGPARDIRGAAYAFNRIYALDSMRNELVVINPVTGVVESAIGVALSTSPATRYNLTNATDIAFAPNGQLILAEGDRGTAVQGGVNTGVPGNPPGFTGTRFYRINPATGVMTPAGGDTVPNNTPNPGGNEGIRVAIGATFTNDTGRALFLNEFNQGDDIFRYQFDGAYTNATLAGTVLTNPVTTLNGAAQNAGRGDLASIVTMVPEPSSTLLIGVGLAGLAALLRRARR